MKDRMITAGTRLCAVIGNPVGHSMSPAIHNAALDYLNLDYVYVAFKVEDLMNALSGMRALSGFRGLSVTIPHKIDVIKYVDEINELDRSIGSINTVINENGRLVGCGTDGPAALKALVDAGVELKGRSVAMVGAGGVARAIAFTLAQKGGVSRITLLDIDEQMLQGLADDLTAGTTVAVDSYISHDDSIAGVMGYADIIINCTPVGMHPHEDATIISSENFRDGQAVFDVVYNPLETRLLREAKARGLIAVSGVDMFINQAALQFEYFTNVEAPVEEMRRVLMEKLGL